MRIGDDYVIRPADPAQASLLPAIEVAAAALFPAEDIAPELLEDGIEVATLERAAREGRLFTANVAASGEPVGFALAKIVDGSGHLHELDVLPEHGRRGLGAALVEAVVSWAREQGFPAVTLTTFRHLPWNAPFYRRLGFAELSAAEVTSELAGMLAREAEDGLDPAKRVAMRRVLV